MSFHGWRQSLAAVLAVAVCGCGSDDDAPSPQPQSQPFAVVSAFPAELAPHVERAVIRDTMVIEGHMFRIGTLDGIPVILALTGIGLVNAATTTRLLLEHFSVQGVVVSAVAGSQQLRIASVAVPATWAEKNGPSYAADPQWLTLAAQAAASGSAALERCTTVAAAAQNPVCLAEPPEIVVGGAGQSADPYGGKAFPCQPRGNDVFACDVTTSAAAAAAPEPVEIGEAHAAADTTPPVAEDMETAAIAGETAARGLPFIAFRAMSDGPGDPLHLGGFPTQFYAYYHLAARNAAAATAAFLKRAAATPRT